MIIVCKADPTGDEEVPDRVLTISGPLPKLDASGPGWHADRQKFYEDQAAMIEEALAGLPGGTHHALLIRLLQRKSNVLSVVDK